MSVSVLTPEAQLLLLTAGGPGVDDAIDALFERDIDWSRLVGLAVRENAVSVLWGRLGSERARGLVPAEVAAQLRKLAMVSEFEMRYLEDRLCQALDTLSAAGIEAILLKGAALGYSVYDSIVERPMADVDLLIRPECAASARALLLDAGWRWDTEGLPDECYDGHHHLPPLTDAAGTGVQLELHTALFVEGHPFRLPLEAVWEHSRALSVCGHSARIPDVHHLLLHLCLHFAWSHVMEVGAWRVVRDVDAISARGGVDWDEFGRLAIESRSATSCYWTLCLAKGLVGTPVPGAVLEVLRPVLPNFVLSSLERHFLLSLLPGEAGCPSVGLRHVLWEWGVLPGRSGHGAVRAWHDLPGTRLAAHRASSPRSAGQRLRNHIRQLDAWVTYLRALVARQEPGARRADVRALRRDARVAPAGPLNAVRRVGRPTLVKNYRHGTW
jgi:hypothetical protein